MLPRNVAGGAMALINSMGALGSFFDIFMGVALFGSVWLTLIVKPDNNQQHPVGTRHA